jgi:hypothetical protein
VWKGRVNMMAFGKAAMLLGILSVAVVPGAFAQQAGTVPGPLVQTQAILNNVTQELGGLKTPQNAPQVTAMQNQVQAVQQNVGLIQQSVTKGVSLPGAGSGASSALLSTTAGNVIPATGKTPGPISNGLTVQVLDGIVRLSNSGGTQNITAGQFGYTASFKAPPVVAPINPGMQFTPPPSFSSSTAQAGAGANAGKSNSVDCEVR